MIRQSVKWVCVAMKALSDNDQVFMACVSLVMSQVPLPESILREGYKQ